MHVTHVGKERCIMGSCDLDGVPRKVPRRASGLSWDLTHGGNGGSTSQWGNSRDKASTWARRKLLRHSRAESTREDGERKPERQGPEGLELRTWLGYSGGQKPMKRWRGLSREVPFTPTHDKSVHWKQVGGEWRWKVADWKAPGFFHFR